MIKICLEILGSLGTPRPSAEILNGRMVNANGEDVHLKFQEAVDIALSKINVDDFDLAILQSRSPTCGVNQIYDGSFNGNLISGSGLFAQALIDRGCKVIDVEDIDEIMGG